MTKEFRKIIDRVDELNFNSKKRAELVRLILKVFTSMKKDDGHDGP